MDKLKRCPFCGGEAELYNYEAERDIYDANTLGYVDTEYFTKYGCACTLCGGMIAEMKSEAQAVEMWNHRVGVVTCEECQHRHSGWYCTLHRRPIRNNGFCSDGKRKE